MMLTLRGLHRMNIQMLFSTCVFLLAGSVTACGQSSVNDSSYETELDIIFNSFRLKITAC